MSHAESYPVLAQHDALRTDAREEASMYGAKRWLWLLSLLPPCLPFLAFLLVKATGLAIFWYFGTIFVHGLVAALDLVVGVDKASYRVAEIDAVEQQTWYRWVADLCMPLQYANLVWAVWMLVCGDLSWFASIGLTLTTGISQGIAITNAHELGHKPELLDRWLAKFVLAPSMFGHFTIEHGAHHSWAATPEDFSSARMGEPIYLFALRTIVGGVKYAWESERERLARRGVSPWSWRNETLNAWAVTVLLFGALVAWLGWKALPWLLVQGTIGVITLQMVNYLQHYGLLREKRADGRYKPCEPKHSWNSSHIATNIMLYHLPRHSDHHAYPMRRYHALRHFEEAPQLPTGYAGMSLITLIPPLWRRLIDPVLMTHVGGDLSKVNMHPPARKQIEEKWGGTVAQ